MPRRAFTLIELVVVIGVLLLLLALLLPVLGRAKQTADGIACSNNCRTLMQGFIAFASDHDGHLPGTFAVRNSWDYDTDHWDWLLGVYSSVPDQVVRCQYAPKNGTLYKYVNNPKAYLCPSLQANLVGSGLGSNGQFDYSAFSVFCGASIKDIKLTSKLYYPPNGATKGYVVDLPTPIICHENSSTINGSNIEGQHANYDRITDVHLTRSNGKNGTADTYGAANAGGGYYAAIDGSVQFLVEPDYDFSQMGTNLWSSIAPSGAVAPINGDPGTWNWWAHQ